MTGSTTGLGEALARLFAHEGEQVIIHGRRRDAAQKLTADIGEQASFVTSFDSSRSQSPLCPRPGFQKRLGQPSSAKLDPGEMRVPLNCQENHEDTELVQIEPIRKTPVPKPEWLKARAPAGENHHDLKRLARSLGLNTVCESAQCPNIGECWHHKTATFMMLGNLCTRRCGFCAVPKGRPAPIDFDEPRRVAEAVAALGLQHAVITSVNRDDDLMGGARAFALVIEEIRRQAPGCRIEVLIPDFQGNQEAIRMVVEARPEVLNHNTESVPRLYRMVRSGARYERTIELLRYSKELIPEGVTKSGVMVGLGEEIDELLQVFRDLAVVHCDILTIGQYLRPSRDHLPIARLYTPGEFADLKAEALRMGFRHVESGPLVRSSYNAHEQAASTG